MGRYSKLSKASGPRRALLRGLVTELLDHERIFTTKTRAKEVQSVAEKMISLARRGDLAARRAAAAYLLDVGEETSNRPGKKNRVLKKLFTVLGPRYQDQSGGYTRVTEVGARRGDAAPMAILELV